MLRERLQEDRHPNSGNMNGSNVVAIGVPSVRDRRLTPSAPPARRRSRASLSDAVEALEKDLIQNALKTAHGNRAETARLLESTERIINYKVRKLGIDYRRFKAAKTFPALDGPPAS